MNPVKYESFYALKENPFSLTPDPRFLFQNKGVHEILRAVLYGLETQRGIIAIIGDAGTGKTTLCRTLLQLLPPKFKTALLLDPHLSGDNLLRAIVDDLGIPYDSSERPALMSALEGFLLRSGQQGCCAVLILDEAQHMSPALLEQVRILSNFETPTRKLLQIVLVGQKELEEKLLRPDLRQLNQRVGVRCHVTPLSCNETFSYIEHRLRIAGLRGKLPLTRPALKRIWAHSGGIPRLINLTCDQTLAAGFISRSQKIGISLVGRGIENIGGMSAHSHTSVRPSMALGCLFLAYMGAMTLFWNGGGLGWLRKLPVLHPISGKTTANVIDTGPTLPEPVTVANTPSQGEIASDYKVLLEKLLSIWGVKGKGQPGDMTWPTTPEGVLDVRLVAARHGLEADLLTSISWSDVETIGLPGILEWDGEAGSYLLTSLENGSALLLSSTGKEKTFTISELRTKKVRSGWFLWRNPDGWTTLPAREWSRRMVTVFAARLYELGYLDYPFPSTYDERFKKAVQRFQVDNRLSGDGILGVSTVMVLARLTDRDNVPQLFKGEGQ